MLFMKTRLLCLLVWGFSLSTYASFDAKHSDLTKVLAANVKQGVVNYPGIKGDVSTLDNYLTQVGEVSGSEFEGWSKDEQMAYLINAYNAFTIKMISDFFPVDSIKDIGGKVSKSWFGRSAKQWKVSEYTVNGKKVVFKAMGKSVTLDEIEHDNLAPKYKDARIHFALSCGSVSCPPLRSEAYVATRLDEQLTDQGKQFLADPFRNSYNDKENTLYLSKVFDWYKKDFTRNGDLISYLKRFIPASMMGRVTELTHIKYLPYDWSLNSKAGK